MIFVPIRTSTLRSNTELSFELFIKIEDRYVLYIKNGDPISKERFDNLKTKKVRQLFIPADQENIYQDFLDNFLKEASQNVMMSSQDKADVVCSASAQTTEQIYKDPSSERSYQKATKAAQNIVDIVAKSEDVLKSLVLNNIPTGAEGQSDILIRHSVNVSTIAARFGEVLGLDNEVLQLYAKGGIYHDIGISLLPKRALELLFTADKNFTEPDWEVYQKHPQEAINALQGKDFVQPQLINLILHHEEKKSGNGFPGKLKDITMEESIFNLCCYYSRRVMCLRNSPEEVLATLMAEEVENYEMSLLQKFKTFLKDEGLY